MPLQVNSEDWNNLDFRQSLLNVSEILREDIEIHFSEDVHKPFIASLCVSDDDCATVEKEFETKEDALEWLTCMCRRISAYVPVAYLREYVEEYDDFNCWKYYYYLDNDSLVEVERIIHG